MKYAVIYEKTNTGYSAYAPDLPGCIATGTSLESTKKRMEKAMEMHLAAMRADNDPIPTPTTQASYIATPRYTSSRWHHGRPPFLAPPRPLRSANRKSRQSASRTLRRSSELWEDECHKAAWQDLNVSWRFCL
jgi:predicted RNase H-like HicB family nuclease